MRAAPTRKNHTPNIPAHRVIRPPNYKLTEIAPATNNKIK